MRRINTLLFLLCSLLTSCYKPYDANIEAVDTILVVDGMITNRVEAYHIRLSYALPFNSKQSAIQVDRASVSVSDDLGNEYIFRELGKGNYVSDSTKFTGKVGRTYILSIKTSDTIIYVSNPQRIEPSFSPDSIYAVVDYVKTISRYNQVILTLRGANIFVNIKSNTNALPRFRFTSDLVKQYFYALQIPPNSDRSPLYFFYCWQTENSGSYINFTNNEYASNSVSINRHSVYFLDDQIVLNGIVYGLGSKQADQSYIGLTTNTRQTYSVLRRILYLNQFSLNSETYYYYRSMDELIRSEGKLFDPIASQLMGNIRCTSDPNKKVFGFFESSSVSSNAYTIGYKIQDKYIIKKTLYILPGASSGCLINKIPPFWIN
jgi:hypothetical protein